MTADTLVREVKVKTKKRGEDGLLITKVIRKVMFTQNKCEICDIPLKRNSSGQVSRFCSKACRKKRHNSKR